MARAAAALNLATSSGVLTERLGKYGMKPLTNTPEQFALLLKSDIERWGPVVKASGFTAED